MCYPSGWEEADPPALLPGPSRAVEEGASAGPGTAPEAAGIWRRAGLESL